MLQNYYLRKFRAGKVFTLSMAFFTATYTVASLFAQSLFSAGRIISNEVEGAIRLVVGGGVARFISRSNPQASQGNCDLGNANGKRAIPVISGDGSLNAAKTSVCSGAEANTEAVVALHEWLKSTVTKMAYGTLDWMRGGSTEKSGAVVVGGGKLESAYVCSGTGMTIYHDDSPVSFGQNINFRNVWGLS